MSNPEWQEAVTRMRARWGDQLDLSDIAGRFLPFFHGPRIRVDLGADKPLAGRVGVTVGWRPSLMLLLREDAVGSQWLLSHTDRLLGVRIGGRYVEPRDPRVISYVASSTDARMIR